MTFGQVARDFSCSTEHIRCNQYFSPGTFSDQLTDGQGPRTIFCLLSFHARKVLNKSPQSIFFPAPRWIAGTTFICKACAPGRFQASGASVSCAPCPAGSFQNETGSIACSRCPLGWHQEAEGSRNCVECSAGATTQILGSTSASDCGCEAESINVAENGEELQCIPCGEGLSCPFSSSLETFKSGQSSQGGAVARRTAVFFCPRLVVKPSCCSSVDSRILD